MIHTAERRDHAKRELLRRHFHRVHRRSAPCCRSTAFSAILTARVVLPIEGRPATMTRSPLLEPGRQSCRTRCNPVEMPVMSPSDWCRYDRYDRRSRAGCAFRELETGAPCRERPVSAISNTRRSASSTRSDAERPSRSQRRLPEISLPIVDQRPQRSNVHGQCWRRHERLMRPASRWRETRGIRDHLPCRARRVCRGNSDTVTTSQGLAVLDQLRRWRRISSWWSFR